MLAVFELDETCIIVFLCPKENLTNFILVADSAQGRAFLPTKPNTRMTTLNLLLTWLVTARAVTHFSTFLVTLVVLTLPLALLHARSTRLFALFWTLAVVAIIPALLLTRRAGVGTRELAHVATCKVTVTGMRAWLMQSASSTLRASTWARMATF